jgi:hypothetical protein
VFPRALLPQVKARPELAQACVYLLLGPRHRLHHHGRAALQGACAVSARRAASPWPQPKRLPLDNANQPVEPSLSEADMEVFLGHMLGMLPVLGVHAFEQAPKVPAAKAGPVLTCKGKGVQATGYEAGQGFVVRAGSQAVADTAPSMAQHVRGMFDLRQELICNGVLAMQGALLQFKQDYTFSAPSTAAAVVLGRSANGRVEWKGADGRTLKELQEAEAAQ